MAAVLESGNSAFTKNQNNAKKPTGARKNCDEQVKISSCPASPSSGNQDDNESAMLKFWRSFFSKKLQHLNLGATNHKQRLLMQHHQWDILSLHQCTLMHCIPWWLLMNEIFGLHKCSLQQHIFLLGKYYFTLWKDYFTLWQKVDSFTLCFWCGLFWPMKELFHPISISG